MPAAANSPLGAADEPTPGLVPENPSRPIGYVEVQRRSCDFDDWLSLFGDAANEARQLSGREMVLHTKRRDVMTPDNAPPYVVLYLGFVPATPSPAVELNPRNLNDAEQSTFGTLPNDVGFGEVKF